MLRVFSTAPCRARLAARQTPQLPAKIARFDAARIAYAFSPVTSETTVHVQKAPPTARSSAIHRHSGFCCSRQAVELSFNIDSTCSFALIPP